MLLVKLVKALNHKPASPEKLTGYKDTKNTNLKLNIMETKQTVVEKYSKEFEEIKKQIELLKAGEILDIQLITSFSMLVIKTYYDGKCEGIQQMHETLKN